MPDFVVLLSIPGLRENDIAAWARRVVRLRDGRVESDTRNDTRSVVEMGQ